jgi:hypothetical protein
MLRAVESNFVSKTPREEATGSNFVIGAGCNL